MTHHTSGNRRYCDHWNFGFAAKPWYRFTGKAGQAMADKYVPPMRCQTLMSGWMDGKHPEVGLKTIANVSKVKRNFTSLTYFYYLFRLPMEFKVDELVLVGSTMVAHVQLKYA